MDPMLLRWLEQPGRHIVQIVSDLPTSQDDHGPTGELPAGEAPEESPLTARRITQSRAVWALAPLVLIVVAVLVIRWPSSDRDGGRGASSSTTTTTEQEATTTTEPPPQLTPEEEALVAGLDDSGVALDEGDTSWLLAAGYGICRHLDDVAEMDAQIAGIEAQQASLAGNPAAADLIEEGNRLINESTSLRDSYERLAQSEARIVYLEFGTEVGDVVVGLTTQHLCPEHAGFTYQP